MSDPRVALTALILTIERMLVGFGVASAAGVPTGFMDATIAAGTLLRGDASNRLEVRIWLRLSFPHRRHADLPLRCLRVGRGLGVRSAPVLLAFVNQPLWDELFKNGWQTDPNP